MPSIFLSELDTKYLRIIGAKPENFGNRGNVTQTSASGGNVYLNTNPHDPLAEKYSVGTRIFHDDYGYGQIVRHNYSEDGDLVCTISFESGGIKKFMPKYQRGFMIVKEDF